MENKKSKMDRNTLPPLAFLFMNKTKARKKPTEVLTRNSKGMKEKFGLTDSIK